MVEVLVAILLLVIGVLGALMMIDTANGTTLANKARTSGVNLARQVAEASRAVDVPYYQLSDGCSAPSSPANPCADSSSIVQALKSQPGITPDANSPAGQWRITPERTAYTVKVSVCAMDDPSDGLGSHSSGGPFCSDAGSTGTTDTGPEDYQRVIVDVSWSGTRGSQDTRAVALIQSDGINGPAVTCLRPTSSPCPASSTPLISSAATTTVPFTATISGSATRLVWSVDGAYAGTVTPSGNTATFTWDLGTVGSSSQVFDGTYRISATAYNSNGREGTTGSVQVQLNRRVPAAPGGFVAGRDTLIGGNGLIGGVDIDWLPVPDKDVLYYRVYQRVGSASRTLLVQTADTSATSYTFLTPAANPTAWTTACANPRQPAASSLNYSVVAVDQNGAATREGTVTSEIDVNACNTAPKNPPTNTLSLTNNADGTLTLTGSLPQSPTDNDTADQVIAVRIYRWSGAGGPSAPADRLEYLPVTNSISYTDASPRPGGNVQKYCFTNVDKRMQESSCSNVVTG